MTSTEPETTTMCRARGHRLLAPSSIANGYCERCRLEAGGKPLGFPERLAAMTDDEFTASLASHVRQAGATGRKEPVIERGHLTRA